MDHNDIKDRLRDSEARLLAIDERELYIMRDKYNNRSNKAAMERLELRIAGSQFIATQILGAVDRTYSCTFWGHQWDYNFQTYDTGRQIKKKICAFCGSSNKQLMLPLK